MEREWDDCREVDMNFNEVKNWNQENKTTDMYLQGDLSKWYQMIKYNILWYRNGQFSKKNS